MNQNSDTKELVLFLIFQTHLYHCTNNPKKKKISPKRETKEKYIEELLD